MSKEKLLELFSVASDGDTNALTELQAYVQINPIAVINMGFKLLKYVEGIADIDLSDKDENSVIMCVELKYREVLLAI